MEILTTTTSLKCPKCGCMLFYSMRRFFWYQIYVSSTLRSQNMNFQRSPASNLAAIAQKSCFWRFLMIKKQLGNVLCAVYVGLTETNRLVPWLRQSDHPIQKYHAPRAARARGTDIYIGFSNFLLHLYWKVLVPIKVLQ